MNTEESGGRLVVHEGRVIDWVEGKIRCFF